MFKLCIYTAIAHIPAQEWNEVCATDFPFIRHEFLSVLEESAAACTDTGWTPQHLAVYDKDLLVAIMPGYLKDHSYGEFVFDFSWAEAYQRHGLSYYPKWISAIPFSPVTGPRLCVREGYSITAVLDVLLPFIQQHCAAQVLSSWHVLFPDQSLAEQLASRGFSLRRAVHFQWLNHNYTCFDDFLATCQSRKRKDIRKERQRVASQGIILERIEGRAMTPALWETFYHFYQMTYLKRSGHAGYLDLSFFRLLGARMPDNLLLVLARMDSNIVAAALNLKDANTLYGRYWGCDEEYPFLHFETCLYQGIDYCIEHGLQRFDPGAQGEHKIQRGFVPTYTYSNHWIAEARFRDAITQFIAREDRHIEHYMEDAKNYLPFRQD